MKRCCFFIVIFTVFFSSQTVFSTALNVEFEDKYNWNRLHQGGPVIWATESNFVVSAERKKNYPVESESVKSERRVLPPFLAVKIVKEDSERRAEPQVIKKEVEVFFPFASSVLKKDQKDKLLEEVKKFSEASDISGIKAEVRGYACPIGKRRYNLKLSKRRAEVVAGFLKKQGVEVESVKGLGVLRESEVFCLDRKAEVILKKTVFSNSTFRDVR